MLLGLADYSRGKETEEGGNEKSRVGGGVSATAVRAVKQDKSSGGTPPPVRWTSLPPSSSSSCLHRRFFFSLLLLLLASSPLFISVLRVPGTQLQLLLLQPIHRACWISSSHSLATAHTTFSIHPYIHLAILRHGDSELALFCCWEGESGIVMLPS